MLFTTYFINTIAYKRQFLWCYAILSNRIKERLAISQPKGCRFTDYFRVSAVKTILSYHFLMEGKIQQKETTAYNR